MSTESRREGNRCKGLTPTLSKFCLTHPHPTPQSLVVVFLFKIMHWVELGSELRVKLHFISVYHVLDGNIVIMDTGDEVLQAIKLGSSADSSSSSTSDSSDEEKQKKKHKKQERHVEKKRK